MNPNLSTFGSFGLPSSLSVKPKIQTETKSVIQQSTAPQTFTTPSGAVVNSAGALITPPKAEMDASALSNATPAVIPPAPQPTTPPPITVPNIDQQAQDFAKAQAPAETPAEKTNSDLISRISSAYEKLTGRSTAKVQAEKQFGIPEITKNINDVTSQITQLQNEAAAKTLESEDRLAPTFAIQGEQAQIERARAVKALRLNAVLSVYQGNYATAQQQVESALEAEFGPAEQEIEFLKIFLDINKDTLSREDKKRAEQLTLQLDERERLLTEQKTEKTQVNNIALEAAKNGADSLTINKILQSKTGQEALSVAGQFVGKLEREQSALDSEYKRAQIAKIQNEISTSGVAGIDAANVIAYAQLYASTGKIPTGIPKGTFGLISQAAKELPKTDGTLVDKNTGIKPDIGDAKVDGLAALYDISKKITQLKEFDKERIGGVISGTFGKIFGSKDQQRYVDLRQEIVDLLARARTGAALTASEEKFYADQLPSRFSEKFFLGADSGVRLDNFESKIKGTLETKLDAFGASIYGFSKVKTPAGEFTVGDILETEDGTRGRVNPDGSITLIQ